MKAFDPIKPWFESAEAEGEYIGIRFGRLQSNHDKPEWIFLSHSEVDGIGGFADILRKRGATLDRLPQLKHPSPPSKLAVLQTIPKFLSPRQKVKWAELEGPTAKGTNSTVPSAVAWQVFTEEETTLIRRSCRKAFFTVNSFLLKHLTKAIRPCLQDQSSTVPWMIPVNLRGKVNRANDIENHTSYISVNVRSFDTVHDIHRSIYDALSSGGHWANWYSYGFSRILGTGMRRHLIRTEKYTSQWHIGAFSNLGDWDPEKKISAANCQGPWLFCPPVLRAQVIGAGCVTFQNRLSIMIQAHSELTTNPAVPQRWIQNWVKEIQMDVTSLLGSK